MARTPRREQDQVRREIIQGMSDYADGRVVEAERRKRLERESRCGTLDHSFPLLAHMPLTDLWNGAIAPEIALGYADDTFANFLH